MQRLWRQAHDRWNVNRTEIHWRPSFCGRELASLGNWSVDWRVSGGSQCIRQISTVAIRRTVRSCHPALLRESARRAYCSWLSASRSKSTLKLRRHLTLYCAPHGEAPGRIESTADYPHSRREHVPANIWPTALMCLDCSTGSWFCYRCPWSAFIFKSSDVRDVNWIKSIQEITLLEPVCGSEEIGRHRTSASAASDEQLQMSSLNSLRWARPTCVCASMHGS